MLRETQVIPESQSLQSENAASRARSRSSRWVFGLLLLLVLVAMGVSVTVITGSTSAPIPASTLTHAVTRGHLVVSVTEQGTLESSNNTEVKCKVRGYSTVIWVIDGGAEVEAGDELVRLDTKAIEDAISLQTTNAHTARATLERSKAEVARAEIAIPAYKEGRYRSQLQSLDRGWKVAKANLLTAQKDLEFTKNLFARGYVNQLKVEADTFLVTQAELELKVKETEIEALKEYTSKMELETLNGNLIAAKSKLEADKAGLAMDEGRLARAKEELQQCVMRADRSGLVIYPSAAQWKQTPDITEGATVRKDQVLLLMPDLARMQVKVGIHESVVDRVHPGQVAKITLSDQTLEGKVASVASVTRPAGWWTGNVVKYDTIVELPSVEGLKPGMSAEVEILLDRHEDVLTAPVAAIVETSEGDFCWVASENGVERRSVRLGDTDDSFLVVESGLAEGEQVVLNPLVFIEEAKSVALKPLQEGTSSPLPSPSNADEAALAETAGDDDAE